MNFSMIYSATKRVMRNTLRVYYLKPVFYRLILVKSQKAYNHHFYEIGLIKFLFFREVILVQSWINRHRSLCKSLKSSTPKSFLRAWFFAATTSYKTVKLANLR